MNFNDNVQDSSKTKRLKSDTFSVMNILESKPEIFDLPCIIYFLHGSKTKQWAYSTNKLEVIKLLMSTLQQFTSRQATHQKITFHCSYPILSVQEASRTGSKQGAEHWVKQRWSKLLPNHLPDHFTFHLRNNPNQKKLLAHDAPGCIEIRLSKSKGAMLAFNQRGKYLILKHNKGE